MRSYVMGPSPKPLKKGVYKCPTMRMGNMEEEVEGVWKCTERYNECRIWCKR